MAVHRVRSSVGTALLLALLAFDHGALFGALGFTNMNGAARRRGLPLGMGRRGHGNARQPPSQPPRNNGDRGQGGSSPTPNSKDLILLASRNITSTEADENEDNNNNIEEEAADSRELKVRGGSSRGARGKVKSRNDDSGPMGALRDIGRFWKARLDGLGKALPFGNAKNGSGKGQAKTPSEKEMQKKEEELMEQLRTMPVQGISVPKSSVLPANVVRSAVKRSGQLGTPLRTDRVQDIARTLKRWYDRNGYPLHSVTGASLDPTTGVAELTLQEPRVSERPVEIVACKQMVIDTNSDGDEEIVTFKEYRRKQTQRKTLGHDRIEIRDLNTTFIETKGRTNPNKVASALKLERGGHFKWEGTRWQRIAQSGVFSQVLSSSPARMPDGTVQLQVIVQEPPPRHLEYGIGKSLYTGSWEGEVDFEHMNLFGGGEIAGLSIKRGTKDAEPSMRVRYSDDNLGLEGGYTVELFSDFIGEDRSLEVGKSSSKKGKKGKGTTNSAKQATATSTSTSTSTTSDSDAGVTVTTKTGYDDDILLGRKGATFTLKNPIATSFIRNSVGTTSVERTSTRTGLHESVGSTSLTLGPFTKELPFQARSNIITKGTTGARLVEKDGDATTADGSSSSSSSSSDSRALSRLDVDVLPYSSISATTRQILPLLSLQSPSSKTGPVSIALSHTVMTSTRNLPRHEANALSIATRIRGCSPDGRVSTSVKGTTELRVPVIAPVFGDGSVVLFSDWFCCQQTHSSPFYTGSSVGVGLRKNLQGLPLKYDLSYSPKNGGKIKAMFSLGQDFDV